mgnify:FL=1
MLDVDEAEKLLSQNRLLKPPLKPDLFPIRETEVVSKNNTAVTLLPKKDESTPTSTESIRSELEFL